MIFRWKVDHVARIQKLATVVDQHHSRSKRSCVATLLICLKVVFELLFELRSDSSPHHANTINGIDERFSIGVEDVSRFVAWLRAPAANVIVFDDRAAVRSAATVNRHLAALFGFYDFHARSGVGVAADLSRNRATTSVSCTVLRTGVSMIM